MSVKKNHVRYVWVAEDYKYGLMGVYVSKKAAEKDFGFGGSREWDGAEGGEIKRWKVEGANVR